MVDQDDKDAERAEGLRQLFNPDGLEPFRDFVPTSDLRRIELCIDQPKLDFPWPYSPDQIRAIFDQTQSARIAEHSEALVSLARRYLGKAWVKIKKGNQKPHVTGELQELAECAHELMSAIDKLSIAAKGHIATAYRMNTPGAPNLLELRHVLDAFLSEHRSLRIDKFGRLAHPFIGPEQERRGRHSSDLERQLIAGLEELFVEAHGGIRPARGWPEFRDAALAPLQPFAPALACVVERKSREDWARPLRPRKGRGKS
ncbi:hypothetical protein M2322_000622 [Rhodoblastus acidophilus]|uniref:hypothetical protein n=1 Tax=Rhodoblastus acidophilus TaxID=1074 RepID=UPI002224311A|nr:hypothetical protein [Rhodoblastus acidophilus]MCW2315102.1 hypothetical protein [Rhodoblastus acidophilus]